MTQCPQSRFAWLLVLFLVAALATTHPSTAQPHPTTLPESAALPATDAEAGRPFITYFSPTDYNAGPTNRGTVQDARGVMFVSNSNGLLEYDGDEWRHLPMPNQNGTRSLARDAQGRIWVGGINELGYLAPDSVGRTAFVSLREHVPETHRDFSYVWNTFATSEGIYFQTSNEVIRWDGETMQVWPAGDTPFHFFSFMVDGVFYVPQPGMGLLYMEHTATGDSLHLAPGGARFADTDIIVMLPFDEQHILINTSDEGFFLYDGVRAVPFVTELDTILGENAIYFSGIVLPDGRFALGSASHGFVVIDRAGRLVQHLHQETGLPSNAVSDLYVDAAGTLWLSPENGIARIEIGAPFTRYDAQTGVASRPLSMARHEGQLFVGTNGSGVSVHDPALGRFLAVEGIRIETQIFSMLAVAGDLLVTATLSGVQKIVDNQAVPVRRPVNGDYIALSLHVRQRDPERVLVGLLGGISVLRRSGTAWVDEGLVPGLDIAAWYMAEAPDGTVWAGTQSGQIIRVRMPAPQLDGTLDLAATEVRIYDENDGLQQGFLHPFLVGNEVYISGFGEAVFHFDEATDRFHPDTTFNEAKSGHPLGWLALREDAHGNVWIASTYGAPVVAYPEADGYRFETLSAPHTSRIEDFYLEADGTVWMLGQDKIIRYNTRQEANAAPSFSPLIREVRLGEDSLLYGGFGPAPPTKVPHGSAALQFAYAAPGATTSIRYRTRLDGFDADWSSWSRETARSYTNLPLGDYRFLVEAEGLGETSYALTVLPPWYRTWWAYGFYALLLGLGIYAVDRVQRQRIIRREREAARERELAQKREIERAYHELRTAKDRLVQQEKMASLGQLTAGIAHEIKNPLNFVNNFASLSRELVDELADETNPDEIQAILVDLKLNTTKIEEHGQRADGIVRSMMQHARAGSGEREAVDLNALVAEHVALAYHGKRAQIPDFNAEIEQDLGADVGQVEVVPQDLGRVLLNLLGNAFDAVRERAANVNGPYAPRVEVSTRRVDEGVEIRVVDNGPGIAKDVRDKIFEPFFTTKPTGSGTGLGLSLSYDIVTQGHGGTLTVESEPGQGAAFVVRMPQTKAG